MRCDLANLSYKIIALLSMNAIFETGTSGLWRGNVFTENDSLSLYGHFSIFDTTLLIFLPLDIANSSGATFKMVYTRKLPKRKFHCFSTLSYMSVRGEYYDRSLLFSHPSPYTYQKHPSHLPKSQLRDIGMHESHNITTILVLALIPPFHSALNFSISALPFCLNSHFRVICILQNF